MLNALTTKEKILLKKQWKINILGLCAPGFFLDHYDHSIFALSSGSLSSV